MTNFWINLEMMTQNRIKYINKIEEKKRMMCWGSMYGGLNIPIWCTRSLHERINDFFIKEAEQYFIYSYKNYWPFFITTALAELLKIHNIGSCSDF